MFFNVLTQVIILLVLILVGVVLARAGIINKAGAACMTDICLLLVTPCVIIKSFIREFDPSALKELLISFLIAACAHIGFILLSRLIPDRDLHRRRVLQFAVIFSNCGFMAIPLQEALLGDEGVFYGSAFIAIFNLFIWSYGILLMSGDKKYLTPKKMLLNPGFIGIAIGLVIFLFSIPLPNAVSQPISYIAALNTPVPMLIIGYHLSECDLLKSLKSIKTIAVILLRLFVFPLAALGVMYLCGIRGTMLVSAVISCSAPTAAITTMFSSKFQNDTELSVGIVSLSTILSLVSMPLIITLAQMLA